MKLNSPAHSKKRWKRSVRANVIKTLHFYVIFVIKYSYYCYIIHGLIKYPTGC